MIKRNSKGYRQLVTAKHRVLGVAFLALCVGFTWFTYAVFSKSFTSYDEVTLKSSRIGLQLPSRADVKIRGVIVGQVLSTKTTGNGVDLTLGLDPAHTDTIPSNVTAEILPKTLFGEKYVSLVVPEEPAATPIKPGAVIGQSAVAIELERVLSDLFPLLRAVKPAELNYTLTALATALEGRGESLGQNIVTLDDYLKRTNPQLPLLVDDLRKLGTVSDTYREVVPELARVLRNSVTTGRTFVSEEAKIQALFQDVASFSSTSRDFLEQNGDNIIVLSKQGQQILPLISEYSSSYPCFLEGVVGLIPREEEAFRNKTLNIILETLPKQPRPYDVGDNPVNGDHRGPWCAYLPAHPFNQQNLPPAALVPILDDGVSGDLGKQRTSPGFDLTSGLAGTAAERELINSVAAPILGVPADQVPDVAALLFGPLARGMQVSLR